LTQFLAASDMRGVLQDFPAIGACRSQLGQAKRGVAPPAAHA
jgi:hypothetical protein